MQQSGRCRQPVLQVGVDDQQQQIQAKKRVAMQRDDDMLHVQAALEQIENLQQQGKYRHHDEQGGRRRAEDRVLQQIGVLTDTQDVFLGPPDPLVEQNVAA